MTNSLWRRIGGIAGIVFGVGTVVFMFGVIVTGAPSLGDPVADIREYFTDKGTTYFILNWVVGMSWVFGLIVFASALRSVLAAGEPEAGMWSRASFAGAVVTAAAGGVGALFWQALALNGPEDLSDAVVRALMRLDALAFWVLVPLGFALFLVGASVVIVRTRVLWKWLGWFGLATALLLLIGIFWVIEGDVEGPLAGFGLIGFLATLLWSMMAGISMIRTEGAP